MKSSYKDDTNAAYNKYAKQYTDKFIPTLKKPLVQKELDRFVAALNGTYVIDLGSGGGDHAVELEKRGLAVLCVDQSKEMIKLCKEKGLDAEIQDIENLSYEPKTFDGIWAYASLLHIPKNNIPSVVEKLAQILHPKGILGLAIKEGEGEGMEQDSSYADAERWFTYFTDDEINEIFSPYFDIKLTGRDSISQKSTFLHYLMTKK